MAYGQPDNLLRARTGFSALATVFHDLVDLIVGQSVIVEAAHAVLLRYAGGVLLYPRLGSAGLVEAVATMMSGDHPEPPG